MSVGELIEVLRKLPPETPVVFNGPTEEYPADLLELSDVSLANDARYLSSEAPFERIGAVALIG